MPTFKSFFNFVEEVGAAISELTAETVDIVKKHPGKVALVCVGTAATGGVAAAFAAPIAAFIGSTGLLGATVSGTAISTLSGAALTNASLAALGGGAIAAGGGGMAAGGTLVTTVGAVVGAAASTGMAVGAAEAEKNGVA